MSELDHKRGLLVSVCGVDGIGKSTLVYNIAAALSHYKSTFLSKRTKRSFELVEQMSGRERMGPSGWNTGSFAQVAATAAAIDFLEHYRDRVLPALHNFEIVITDRYALCYATYLKCTGSPIDPEILFANVTKPDLIIVLDAPMSTVAERLMDRGGADDDENPELAEQLSLAYRQMAGEFSMRHVILPASGTRQQVFEAAYSIIKPMTAKLMSYGEDQ